MNVKSCLATVAVAGLGLVFGCRGGADPDEKAKQVKAPAAEADVVALPAEAMRVAAIQTATAQSRAAIDTLTINGSVQPDQQRLQQVTAPVAGRVVRVLAALGERVVTGVPVVIMTSPEIGDVRSRLVQAEGRESVARAAAARTRRLVEIGAAAGKETEMATAEQQAASAEVAHLRGVLTSYGTAGGDPGSIALRAPASGVIVERTVNAGAVVQTGQQLLSIADLSSVWIIANVAEAQIGAIRAGMRADVIGAALGSNVVFGTVDYIDPIVRPDSHTVGVRIRIANTLGLLRPGMFVEVRIRTSASNGVAPTLPWVPEPAIEHIGERTVVFVPIAPNTFRAVDVQVGESMDGYRPILSGITAGQVVVMNGTFALKSQMLKRLTGDTDQ